MTQVTAVLRTFPQNPLLLDRVFFALASLFVVVNILNIRTGIYVAAPTAATTLALLLYNRRELIPHAIICVLILDIRYIIYILILYFIFQVGQLSYRCIKKKTTHLEVLYLVTSCLGLLIAFNAGGNSNYNITKFLSLYVPIGLLLSYRRAEKSPQNYDKITIIYVLSILVSIISKFLHFPDARNSIFNGSENIGFFIITIIMITAVLPVRKLLHLLALFLLYLLYVVSTESRTAFISAAIFLAIILFYKLGKTIFLCIAAPIFMILALVSDKIGVLSLIQRQINVFVANVDDVGFLKALSLIDARGELYTEAIELIWKSPIVGNGSIAPTKYNEAQYGIQAFHNTFLDLMVTFGLIGLTLYAVTFLLSLNELFRNKIAYILMITAFLFLGFFQPIVFNIQAMLVFFLSISLLEASVFLPGTAGLRAKNVD